MASLDLELVRHALDTAQKHGFREVELTLADDQFSAKLSARPRPQPAAGAEQTSEDAPQAEMIETLTVVSTLVGYYQEGETPLTVGQTIEKGDNIAVIVALGLANDVESKVSGEVVELLVEPGQAVEYGQALAKVKPL